MQRKLKAVFLLSVTVFLAGCTQKPTIPGYHWNGGTLYDADGVEVADVVTFLFDSDSAQDCIFKPPPGQTAGCDHWETGQLAFDDVGRIFGVQKTPKRVKEPECAQIHKPANGCPAGWTEHPGIFTEKDGSQVSSCTAPAGSKIEPCTDYLAPGESQKFQLIIPTEPDVSPQQKKATINLTMRTE